MEEFLSPDKAKEALERTGELFGEYMGQCGKKTSCVCRKFPFSYEWTVGPAMLTDEQWGQFRRELAPEVKSITDTVNAEKKLSGNYAMRGRVLGDAVYSWQVSWLSLNSKTGTVPHGTEQKELKVLFDLPHKISYR